MFVSLFFLLIVSKLKISSGVQNVGDSKQLYSYLETDKCTAIGVGPKAMKDGSTVTTHNNDCQECDFRITHVPARDWPKGSKRPIYDIRNAYPRYVQKPPLQNDPNPNAPKIDPSDLKNDQNNIYGPDYIRSASYPDASIFKWNDSIPFTYIDQVDHTYGYTLGTYAIQNEKQVSIGESTCSSKFVSKPLFAEGGKAMMHMETLTEIALERCATARCALQTMGDLAVRYGFYGPGWEVLDENAEDESGEALVVSDAHETWMFHVMPDDTGSSAIWVGQKVPDDHITVVANQFVVGEIDPQSSDFMMSDNIYAVAERNKLWSAATADTVPFHFSRVYGNDRKNQGYACTRRMWRVFTLAAPSLIESKLLSPFTDGLATFGYGADLTQPYPFSVKPDKLLTVQDIMNMNRDQFEGSLFDLTVGLDAGMYGDPMRFPAVPSWQDKLNGVTWEQWTAGVGFERPISLWRTAYSSVTQSRHYLPDAVGAVAWIAQYAPHHSTFAPVYAAAEKTPSSLNTGTQYKVDKAANWWIHCITGNYLSRWYRYTIEDVKKFQAALEMKLFINQVNMEREAIVIERSERNILNANTATTSTLANTASAAESVRRVLAKPVLPEPVPTPTASSGDNAGTPPQQQPVVPNRDDNGSGVNDIEPIKPITLSTYLMNYHEKMAIMIRDEWWDFFFHMAGTYRDMYKVSNPHTENFARAFRYVGVQKWWFEQIGFWGELGTPAPGEFGTPGKATPIHRYTYPSESSLVDYQTKYPHGYNATFPTFHPIEEYSVLNSENKLLFQQVNDAMMGVIIASFCGLLMGMILMYVYLTKCSNSSNRGQYAPLK